jgi:hypothetical protein
MYVSLSWLTLYRVCQARKPDVLGLAIDRTFGFDDNADWSDRYLNFPFCKK